MERDPDDDDAQGGTGHFDVVIPDDDEPSPGSMHNSTVTTGSTDEDENESASSASHNVPKHRRRRSDLASVFELPISPPASPQPTPLLPPRVDDDNSEDTKTAASVERGDESGERSATSVSAEHPLSSMPPVHPPDRNTNSLFSTLFSFVDLNYSQGRLLLGQLKVLDVLLICLLLLLFNYLVWYYPLPRLFFLAFSNVALVKFLLRSHMHMLRFSRAMALLGNSDEKKEQ